MATTSSAPADSHQIVSATYQSPSNAAFTFFEKIPTPATTLPKDKVAYLSALRKATAAMQEHINTELTARMEEDKARQPSTATSGKDTAKTVVVDEAKEEDNYGEEVVEED